MVTSTGDISPGVLDEFDDIVDVRSPAEYAEDHLPRSINLPVLSNEERAQVGVIYKQQSPFMARKLGAAFVARNVARYVETELADRPRDWRPLLYCWRGGMRSNSFATVLSSVGWRTHILDGGWRHWRRSVVKRLYDEEPKSPPILLVDGQTGSAKTAILHRLKEKGVTVLDLEGLARHRGSVFGRISRTEQPSQKTFETAIYDALVRTPQGSAIVVEAESTAIGARRIPKAFWMRMASAPRLEICAPPEARAGYLVTSYKDLIDDPDALHHALGKLSAYHSRENIASWRALIEAKRIESFQLS